MLSPPTFFRASDVHDPRHIFPGGSCSKCKTGLGIFKDLGRFATNNSGFSSLLYFRQAIEMTMFIDNSRGKVPILRLVSIRALDESS